MKTLALLAVVLGAGMFGTSAQAGIVCGPGFHLRGGVCVHNVVVVRRACAIGMRLGPAGLCIR
jgi:hypothetical protein